ncbi:hypothetical protein [Cohnella terricola]|uniref:DUF5044 domain-containing protein n=1 Tax=Cohnella terricola TaxID=1289167 RepID=A0A559JX57_9BACL|nr:hypothetical protein [Cohnella terricola]TVY04417.1 hypothetical protein FPZ45_02210 [Cohnella terricola]
MKKKTLFAIGEWIAVALLIWLCFHENLIPIGGSTPEETHRLSESSFHYGPSEIVRKVEVPFDKDQVIFLGTYKDWFSADSVYRKRGGWFPGGGVAGVEIDRDKAFSYSWEGNSAGDSQIMYKFYGYVSDDRIATMELLMTEKDTGKPVQMREEITNDRMFLFLWKIKDGSRDWQAIRGLDKDNKVIYEQTFGT